MARLYFHTHNGQGAVHDEEGREVQSEADAYRVALESIRSIVAEDARSGLIDLEGRLDVAESDGGLVLTVPFIEAFEIRLPDDGVG